MNPNEYKRGQKQKSILKLLKEKPLTFSQLLKATGLHPEALNRELKKMRESKIIKKDIFDNEPVYKLTKSGNEEYEKLWHIESIIREMKSLNSGSLLTYWKSYGIEYSIIQDTEFLSKNEIAHLIFGENPEYFKKEGINPQSLADEITKYIRDWIIRYVNDKGLKSSNFQDGHLILTYTFDFKKMSEYLKQFEISGDLQ